MPQHQNLLHQCNTPLHQCQLSLHQCSVSPYSGKKFHECTTRGQTFTTKKSIKFTKERPVLNVSSVTSEVMIKVALRTTYKQPIRNFHFKVIFFKSMNIDIQSAQEFIQTTASANSLLRPPAANLHFYVLGTIYSREEYTWCFSHSPKLVGPWSYGHPVGGWLPNWSSDWTAENKHVPAWRKAEHREAMSGMFCKRCGVEKISKHYRVGHWSAPCRPLFLTVPP